jgi:membrane protease YdiL (CAAX protease family)
VICAACVLLGLLVLVSARRGRPTVYGALLVVTGLLAASLLPRRTREVLSRVLPVRPASALDATALVLTVVLVGSQAANQLAVDVLAEQRLSGPQLTPLDLLAQELPFLAAALLGVGLFTRRPLAAAFHRLGLVRPLPWQLALALAAAGLFFAFSSGVDLLSQRLTPDLTQKVDAANQRLFGRLGDPLGIATIALAAGVCEEVLFRGALQPSLGITWTAVVFAAVHSQYGLSLDALAVFVLALCLGVIRLLANTTTTVVCHVAYNALVGVGVAGAWLLPALLVEAALILLTTVTFFTTRVGASRLAP